MATINGNDIEKQLSANPGLRREEFSTPVLWLISGDIDKSEIAEPIAEVCE